MQQIYCMLEYSFHNLLLLSVGDIGEIPNKRARIEFTLANPTAELAEGTPGQSGDHEGAMVINTSQQVSHLFRS